MGRCVKGKPHRPHLHTCQPQQQGIESHFPGDSMPCDISKEQRMQAAHLNIIKDQLGNYFVEVAQGADRITLTPQLWSTNEASEALRRIASATGLPAGRSV